MAQLAVTISGRVYRVACDEGEQARLEELAQLVDAKIEAMRAQFGEIGDGRLTVMAAITLADQWLEASERARQLDAELTRLKSLSAAPPEWTEKLAASLGHAADQIENIAQKMNEAGRD